MNLPANDPKVVEQILKIADTYFINTHKLIYAYRGRTFLGDGDLFDYEWNKRGNIDCSTYVQLVLQGIDFDHSPYVLEEPTLSQNTEYDWIQDCLYEKLKEDNNNRRANAIAKCYWDMGRCFEDMSMAQPGDLVFYRAPDEVAHFYRQQGTFREICHVGIVAADGVSMYNSTGLPEKKEQEEQHLDAIQLTPLVSDRAPSMFARPLYRQGR